MFPTENTVRGNLEPYFVVIKCFSKSPGDCLRKVSALPKLKVKIPVEDYLEGEKISEVRRESIDGEVYAMAGTSKNHKRAFKNLLNRLSAHLRESGCEPFFRGYESSRQETQSKFFRQARN